MNTHRVGQVANAISATQGTDPGLLTRRLRNYIAQGVLKPDKPAANANDAAEFDGYEASVACLFSALADIRGVDAPWLRKFRPRIEMPYVGVTNIETTGRANHFAIALAHIAAGENWSLSLREGLDNALTAFCEPRAQAGNVSRLQKSFAEVLGSHPISVLTIVDLNPIIVPFTKALAEV